MSLLDLIKTSRSNTNFCSWKEGAEGSPSSAPAIRKVHLFKSKVKDSIIHRKAKSSDLESPLHTPLSNRGYGKWAFSFLTGRDWFHIGSFGKKSYILIQEYSSFFHVGNTKRIPHHFHIISLPNPLATEVFHPIPSPNDGILKARKCFMYSISLICIYFYLWRASLLMPKAN